MKPQISIIVPIYNVEKYLRKCLDSILQQTFRDYELILVDDGAEDSSSFICDEYAAKDSRVKVIHKQNGGLSSARNTGLDIASGRYIALIDSDDWIALDMLEILHNNIVHYNADISQCEFVKAKNDHELEWRGNVQAPPKVYTNRSILEKLHAPNSITYSVVWNKLYRAELFHNIRFPEGKTHEDEFVNYKLISSADRIVCSQSKMYFYRQRANSIMGKKFNLSRMDGLEAYIQRKDFYKHIKQRDLYKRELLHILKHISWMYTQIKSRIKDNKKILRYLSKLYRKTVMELVLTGYHNKKLVGFLINCIVPDLYDMETSR